MDKYIVISPHTAEDCKQAVREFRQHNAGFLTHFDWGCADNDHTAYAVFEAENHETAKMSVPPLFRDKSKAVRLVNFDPAKSKDPYHK